MTRTIAPGLSRSASGSSAESTMTRCENQAATAAEASASKAIPHIGPSFLALRRKNEDPRAGTSSSETTIPLFNAALDPIFRLSSRVPKVVFSVLAELGEFGSSVIIVSTTGDLVNCECWQSSNALHKHAGMELH